MIMFHQPLQSLIYPQYGAETFSKLFLILDLPKFFYGISYADLSFIFKKLYC